MMRNMKAFYAGLFVVLVATVVIATGRAGAQTNMPKPFYDQVFERIFGVGDIRNNPLPDICKNNGIGCPNTIKSPDKLCLRGKCIASWGELKCSSGAQACLNCVNAGGDFDKGQGVCYFVGSICPAGWQKNSNYSSTLARTCGGVPFLTDCGGYANGCTTLYHPRADKKIDACYYWPPQARSGRCYGSISVNGSPTLPYPPGDNSDNGTCYATQTEVGCRQ